MCEISCVLEGEDQVHCGDTKDLSDRDIVCYQYARPVSRDMERTYCQYKSLFRESR
jgi:hypothetical protein